jgi:hypothetical protein
MRWIICLGLTLSLAACRQTVVLDESAYDGGGGGNGGADAGLESRFDGGALCPGMPIMITPQSPKVMVVLDRSDGMTGRFADSTPLAAARDALDQYSTRYQSVVWFGYSDFPGTMPCGAQACCIGSNFIQPGPKLQSFSMALHACDVGQTCATPTGSQRPTLQALSSIATFTFNQSDPLGRYVLLITNGRPDCASSGPGPGSCGDGGNTVNAVTQLWGKNVLTYLVAPGQPDQETMQCLRDLAVAGGTISQPSYFHASQDPPDLNGEIGDIIREIARDACTLDSEGMRIDPTEAALVWKDMQSVPRGGNSGWDITDNGYSITLRGQWCDQLVSDGPTAFKLYSNCGPHH